MGSSTQKAGILQKSRESTKWVLPDTAKKRMEQQQLPTRPAEEIILSDEKQILKQVHKYELTTQFTGGNSKLFPKN